MAPAERAPHLPKHQTCCSVYSSPERGALWRPERAAPTLALTQPPRNKHRPGTGRRLALGVVFRTERDMVPKALARCLAPGKHLLLRGGYGLLLLFSGKTEAQRKRVYVRVRCDGVLA